jgi:iron-sulfur cluster assembly protein
MLFVSDSAKEKITDLLQDEDKGPGYFVRVAVKAGGCSGLSYEMTFDNESQAEDEVFEDKGIKIVTDSRSILYLLNTTLNFSDGLNGKGFEFQNPNATRSCGCGESFSI